MNKFLGCQYPLVKTSRGLLAQNMGVDQIKADMLQLLLTNPGERVMMPTYGTPLRTLLFEPGDPALALRAKKMISDSILAWEPRIVVENITVNVQPESSSLNPADTNDGHILYIKIDFIDPENIQQVEVLELSQPIGG